MTNSVPAGSSRKRRLIIAGVAAIAAIAVLAWFRGWREGEQTVFQGYVEGNLVYLSPESAGRIDELMLTEGQTAKPDQIAFRMESSLQIAQRNEAAAKLNQIRSQLEDLRAAQQRPEQIDILRAQEDQAKAALDLARTELQRQRTLFDRGYTAKANLDQAQTSFDRNSAALSEAQRQITAAELGARSAAIDAGEASVRAAEAGLVQAETVLTKRDVLVPTESRVQEIFFRAGEVVNAGQPVLSLLPPQNLKYRFYVPAPVLATLRVGQEIGITCDSCAPDLRARVSFMSSQAEFTPPVIFSDEERAKLVFKVEALPVTPVELPIGLPLKARTNIAPSTAG